MCDTPGSWRATGATGPLRGGCSAIPLLHLKKPRILRRSAATRVARQGVPANLCNYASKMARSARSRSGRCLLYQSCLPLRTSDGAYREKSRHRTKQSEWGPQSAAASRSTLNSWQVSSSFSSLLPSNSFLVLSSLFCDSVSSLLCRVFSSIAISLADSSALSIHYIYIYAYLLWGRVLDKFRGFD